MSSSSSPRFTSGRGGNGGSAPSSPALARKGYKVGDLSDDTISPHRAVDEATLLRRKDGASANQVLHGAAVSPQLGRHLFRRTSDTWSKVQQINEQAMSGKMVRMPSIESEGSAGGEEDYNQDDLLDLFAVAEGAK